LREELDAHTEPFRVLLRPPAPAGGLRILCVLAFKARPNAM
jgi:hypothetical protein